MADVVFILGAGCSVHAGAPVMANFIECARDLFAIGAVKDKQAEFELAFETISYLQRVHSKAQLDHNNIETVFSAVDLARTLKTLPGISPDKIDAAAKALTWMIVRTIEQSMAFPTKDRVVWGTAEYVRLANLILELKTRTPALTSAVLTFNYDVGADFSFDSEGLSFNYGLDEGGEGVPLLKLHGSLNWFRSRESRQVVAYHPRNYRGKFLLQYPDGKDRMVFCPVSSQMAGEYQLPLGVDREPVLVPPTWSKGEYHREIASVWRRAAAELKEARYIYVIGYSLPPTDQFFRLLFALGTEGQAILNTLGIYDVTPEPVVERFRATLGNAALDVLQYSRNTFGEALNHIHNQLFRTGRRMGR